eukprot:Gb_19686 [translate_table: standard]
MGKGRASPLLNELSLSSNHLSLALTLVNRFPSTPTLLALDVEFESYCTRPIVFLEGEPIKITSATLKIQTLLKLCHQFMGSLNGPFEKGTLVCIWSSVLSLEVLVKLNFSDAVYDLHANTRDTWKSVAVASRTASLSPELIQTLRPQR